MRQQLFCVAAAALLAAVVAGSHDAVGAAEAPSFIDRFEFTGDVQTWTVPAETARVHIVACGAQGEAVVDPATGATLPGGRGGRAESTVAVTAGETLWIHAGESGTGGRGGFNGGGSGGTSGGGASDVRGGAGGLGDRLVIGGGGGGSGSALFIPPPDLIPGTDGGGTAGVDYAPYLTGGTQTGPGQNTGYPAGNGALGVGGNGELFGGGGGGGLYGGAGGDMFVEEIIVAAPGTGGSGLGDAMETGACEGHGWVELRDATDYPAIRPFGVLVEPEGDSGSAVWQLPVSLSAASSETVTVGWSTVDTTIPGIAEAGTDFEAAAGTLAFAPGETVQYVPVEVLGDTADEPPLLWGEWGVVVFHGPSNATIDRGGFFGAGLFIIVDDD